jgi:hypothetical protein
MPAGHRHGQSHIGESFAWFDELPTDAPPASAPRDDGRTHYDDTDTAKGCWTEHHDCARAEIERLRSALASRDAEIAEMEQVARCSGDGFQQALDAIRERDAEIARLREALKAARASLAKIHVSDGSYPVYHLICDVLDHPARALAAPPDTTTETPHGNV